MRVSGRLLLTFILFSVFTAEASASQMSIDASHTADSFRHDYNIVQCSGISAADKNAVKSGKKSYSKNLSEKSKQNSSPLIALTFDDGPALRNTGRILDVLEENDSKATFFMIGCNIKKNPDVMMRAYSMGCEIGNHTYSHTSLTKLSVDDIKNEISMTNDVIFDYLLADPRFMRVPACQYNKNTKSAINMPIILWSIDTRDWRYGSSKSLNTKSNRQKIIDEVLSKAKDGDIILMHDIYTVTADSCEILIPELCRMGFKLVTLSELFDAKAIEPGNGKIYYSAKK